ncbi:MAG: hypothetical protein KA146_09720 [Leptospiraceae bacterium]|nr:hypothetical protein [Leptospiraceae bacterium]
MYKISGAPINFARTAFGAFCFAVMAMTARYLKWNSDFHSNLNTSTKSSLKVEIFAKRIETLANYFDEMKQEMMNEFEA